MTQIEELQKLDLEQVQPDILKDQILQLLGDYEEEEDKKLFMREAGGNVTKLFELVKKHCPDAIVSEKAKKSKSKSSKEKEKEAADEEAEKSRRKANSKKVMEEVEEIGKEIESCRQVIKDYNKKKREAEGKEPVKKTRITKLKEKLLGIAGLIPENLKESKEARDKTEKILLGTLSELKKAWRLNLIKDAQKAIKEKFDELEEKEQKKEEKKAA